MAWGVWVLLIVVIAIVIFIIVWSFFATNKPGVSAPATLQGACAKSNDCAAGLVCDPVYEQCKLPEGKSCSNYAQCQFGYYCSRVCTKGPYGQQGQNCPCVNGNVCVASKNGANICKAGTGAACSVDSDCFNNYCAKGVCSAGQADGTACTSSSQCLSLSYCDPIGFCQPQGIISGTPGAACFPGQNSPSVSIAKGVNVKASEQKYAGCNAGNACANGHCFSATAGLGGACSPSKLCAAPMACSVSVGVGTCKYPSPVNTCPAGTCATNFSCNSGLCYAQSGQACAVGGDCASGKCASPPSLYSTATSVLNSTSLSWTPSPVPTVTVYRVTGYSNRLFLITASGLYSFNGTSWALTLPNNGNNILVDGCATASLILLIIGSAIMTYDPNSHVISPYITANGVPVDASGNPLVPTGIDISATGEVVILAGGKPYTLTSSSFTLYPGINGVTLVRWYYPPANTGATVPALAYTQGLGPIHFTGPASSLTYPQGNFSVLDFSPSPSNNGTVAVLAQNNDTNAVNIIVIIGGSQYILPGFGAVGGHVLVTNDNLWWYSPTSCA